MTRAEKSGIALSEDDAATVRGMIERGDRQHDIAAWFGVNAGRIAEITTGETFANIKATKAELPPKGPYVSGKRAHATTKHLKHIRTSLETAIEEVDEAIVELSENSETKD